MHPDSGERGITHRRAAAVEGDDVARLSHRAAHGVVVAVVNGDPARGVAQRLCACDIGADDITLDEVAGRVLSEDHTRVAIVARDQIARRVAGLSRLATDEVTRDATVEIHANVWISQSDFSGAIRTDEVALDRVVRSSEDVNAAIVRGDDVTGINGRAADEVI